MTLGGLEINGTVRCRWMEWKPGAATEISGLPLGADDKTTGRMGCNGCMGPFGQIWNLLHSQLPFSYRNKASADMTEGVSEGFWGLVRNQVGRLGGSCEDDNLKLGTLREQAPGTRLWRFTNKLGRTTST